MPKILVKFVAGELAPGLENGSYTVPDGASVMDLIAVCEQECGVSIPGENYRLMYPLFGGKPVQLDSTLTKDGTLHLCRILMGG